MSEQRPVETVPGSWTCDRCRHPFADHRQAGESGSCLHYGCGCRRTQWFLFKQSEKKEPDGLPLDVPPDMGVLAAILEDVPPQIINSALLDSGEGLAGMIVSRWPEYARIAAEYRDDPSDVKR